MIDYFYTTIQSNLLEIPVYYLFYRKHLNLRQVALIATFANAITHPWVFFGFMGVGISYFTSVLLAESFAVLSEGPLHSYAGRLMLRRTLAAALIANLFSWQLAPAITYFLFF